MSDDFKIEKEWKHAGLNCCVLFIRNSHRCGYVAVGKKNIAYQLSYEEVPVSVHGGLTYGGDKNDFAVKTKLKSDYVWFGFDCMHSGDKSFTSSDKSGHFWTFDEVVKETEDLAEQLKKITWKEVISKKLEYMPDWFVSRISIKR